MKVNLNINDEIIHLVDQAKQDLDLDRSELINYCLQDYINFRCWDAQDQLK